MTTSEALQHYVRHDALTDPAGLARLYDELPDEVSGLCNVVSGLIVHTSWAATYGIPAETPLPRDTKPVAERLAEIQQLFDGPLIVRRSSMQRPFGTCRDYALLLCSALRHRSIPARVRCGFATYFASRRYADHWICEYWMAEEGRWAVADAQIDRLQRNHLAIEFDCADLPAGAFLVAPSAWKLARSKAADPAEFGHGDVGGLWFLYVNLHRDLLALSNCHKSAWDTWRAVDEAGRNVSDSQLSGADRLADLLMEASSSGEFSALQGLAARFRMPPWHQATGAQERSRQLANLD